MKNLREALVWNKERNGVRCNLCNFRCFVARDKPGKCKVRVNRGNRLFATFGLLDGLEFRRIEKSNAFHFLPGSDALFVSFHAPKEWQIPFELVKPSKRKVTPESLVKYAERKKSRAIVYTGIEPTLAFEFVRRTARLARRVNMKNVFVTMGMISEEAIKKFVRYIDAVVVHFFASGNKSFMKSFTLLKNPRPVYRTLLRFAKYRVHLEICNTIIPQIGDNLDDCRKLAQWIISKLNAEVPLHMLRFYPYDKLQDLPMTSLETLERCASVAKASGLRYVYMGKLVEHTDWENTYCYNCRELLIERKAGKVVRVSLHKDRCPVCGVKINVIL